jgi:hypothetical protein
LRFANVSVNQIMPQQSLNWMLEKHSDRRSHTNSATKEQNETIQWNGMWNETLM